MLVLTLNKIKDQLETVVKLTIKLIIMLTLRI
jgi:hypothetical protein